MASEGFDHDSALRARVRRLAEKARYLMRGGYLELAAGRQPCRGLVGGPLGIPWKTRPLMGNVPNHA